MHRLAAALLAGLTALARAPAASPHPPGGPTTAATAQGGASAAGPSYEAPAWVRERRRERRRSPEQVLAAWGDAAQTATALRRQRAPTPDELAAMAARQMEDFADLAAECEDQARALEAPFAADPQIAALMNSQRADLRRMAVHYRESTVSTARFELGRAPNAPSADELFFRMATEEAALGRGADAARSFDAMLARFPGSPFAPHVRLAAGERAFARGEWAAAAEAYERASLPASADNRVRAYALYRLAWARALAGEPDVALARFDEALAWVAGHPYAPDVARLAEAARRERAALAARLAAHRPALPSRPSPHGTAPLRAPRAPAAPAARPKT